MERIGAGNLLGAGNVGFDEASCGSLKGLGGISGNLRGKQESPFEGGPKSFLSSTHLKSPVDETGDPSKNTDKAMLGEVLSLLKEVISLVEQLFVGKREGAPSPSKPEENGNTPAKPEAPVAQPAESAASTGVMNEQAVLGEVLGLLKTLIELLEKKFGGADDAKGSGNAGASDRLEGADKEILSQVLDLVTQLIQLIQQYFGGGDQSTPATSGAENELADKVDRGLNNISTWYHNEFKPEVDRLSRSNEVAAGASSGKNDVLQGFEALKSKLESIAGDSGYSPFTPDVTGHNISDVSNDANTIERPAADPVGPSSALDSTGLLAGGDGQILGEILSLLSQVISLLQQLGGVDKKSAA